MTPTRRTRKTRWPWLLLIFPIIGLITCCAGVATLNRGGTDHPAPQTTASVPAVELQASAPVSSVAPAAPSKPPTTAPVPRKTTKAPGVYYANCAAAKAAGAAPLRRGDPGYRSGLDRDGDGVACET